LFILEGQAAFGKLTRLDFGSPVLLRYAKAGINGSTHTGLNQSSIVDTFNNPPETEATFSAKKRMDQTRILTGISIAFLCAHDLF
jgi:hypothetical protein